MVLRRAGECLLSAVKAGPRYTARILFINGLSLGAPVRIQPNLSHVSERAHQRAGEARKATDRLQRYGYRDRCSDHHVAIAFSAKIEHRSLPGKHPAFWCRNYGGETGRAPGFHAFVTQAGLIGRTPPWRRSRPILRASRSRRLQVSTAF